MPERKPRLIPLDSFCSLGDAPRALISEVRAGRAPHAVLISGVAGTGKRSLARLLACALLCTHEGTRPCMQCKGCRRALAGTHPDFLVPSCTEKDRTIKVDHLREVLRALAFHAMEGRRVVLLENAQRMTMQAQNALLKSLEEPDSETHFILTASGDAGLLPTVRSRCRIMRMPLWPAQRIEDALTSRGTQPEQAREIASLCGGSLGAALDMADNPSFFALHTLCERTFFSVRSAQEVPILSALLKDKKDDADELLTLLSQRAREYLRCALHAQPEPEGAQDAACHLWWVHAAPERIERVLLSVLEARKQRAANVSWPAIAENLLFIISEEIVSWQPS